MGAPTPTWMDLGPTALRYDCRAGDGPLLVLLHEMGGSLESWDDVVSLLPADCAVLRYDMRGAGMSERLLGPVCMDTMAEDLARLLARLGVDGPVIPVGCAVGAGVALRFAMDFPARTAAVVAINPAIDVTPAGAAGLVEFAGVLAAQGTRSIEAAALDGPYPDRYRQRDPARFARFRARWLANDPVSLGWHFRMLAETDLGPELDEIGCPVVLVAGRHDPLRPPEYVRGIAQRLPDAQVIEIDAGHHAPDHAPAEVARAIETAIDAQAVRSKQHEDMKK